MIDIVNWINKKVKEAKAKGVVVAVSGGVDSAVVAALAKKAFPNNSLALWLDIESSLESKRNYLRTVESIKIKHIEIDLKQTYDNLIKNIFEVSNIYKDLETYEKFIKNNESAIDYSYLKLDNLDGIKGNIKSRLRMIALYAQAQKNGYLVLSTSNKSEIEAGYFTKWGDGAGDIAPISHLYKSSVYDLAKDLKIPKQVIDAAPSADLWENQTDEDEMGFTYDELESYLEGNYVPLEKKDIIKSLIKKNKHKKLGVIKYNIKKNLS